MRELTLVAALLLPTSVFASRSTSSGQRQRGQGISMPALDVKGLTMDAVRDGAVVRDVVQGPVRDVASQQGLEAVEGALAVERPEGLPGPGSLAERMERAAQRMEEPAEQAPILGRFRAPAAHDWDKGRERSDDDSAVGLQEQKAAFAQMLARHRAAAAARRAAPVEAAIDASSILTVHPVAMAMPGIAATSLAGALLNIPILAVFLGLVVVAGAGFYLANRKAQAVAALPRGSENRINGVMDLHNQVFLAAAVTTVVLAAFAGAFIHASSLNALPSFMAYAFTAGAAFWTVGKLLKRRENKQDALWEAELDLPAETPEDLERPRPLVFSALTASGTLVAIAAALTLWGLSSFILPPGIGTFLATYIGLVLPAAYFGYLASSKLAAHLEAKDAAGELSRRDTALMYAASLAGPYVLIWAASVLFASAGLLSHLVVGAAMAVPALIALRGFLKHQRVEAKVAAPAEPAIVAEEPVLEEAAPVVVETPRARLVDPSQVRARPQRSAPAPAPAAPALSVPKDLKGPAAVAAAHAVLNSQVRRPMRFVGQDRDLHTGEHWTYLFRDPTGAVYRVTHDQVSAGKHMKQAPEAIDPNAIPDMEAARAALISRDPLFSARRAKLVTVDGKPAWAFANKAGKTIVVPPAA